MSKPLIFSQFHVWVRVIRYLAGKALTIAITIFIGVFITLLIANRPTPGGFSPGESAFEVALEEQIQQYIRDGIANGMIHRMPDGSFSLAEIEELTNKLRKELGLDLPFFPRYILWTTNALRLNWGELNIQHLETLGISGRQSSGNEDVVLAALPNTLLLVGTAFLIVYLLGMPLALYLSRHHGSFLDRLFSFFSPISSVPSWVFAILLIAIFAVNLKWLPPGGRFDFVAPSNSLEYIIELSRHMVLPVASIVFSSLFQVVYAWRTFFIIYSEEDYVELARAKGLSHKILENQYILRPALPFVVTSFVTVIISFWQLTVALELIFQWPGIGLLYIKDALPNYWGELIYPGQLMLVIEIVVIFAYLLGTVVFFLDLIYVIVDPRIRLLPDARKSQGQVKTNKQRFELFFKNIPGLFKRNTHQIPKRITGQATKRDFLYEFFGSMQNLGGRIRLFFYELRRYPSAIFGLVIITIMLIGSIYALIGLPYEQYGREYLTNRSTGFNYRPRTAKPEWLNLFSPVPWLSSVVLNEDGPQTQVAVEKQDNGWIQKTTTFVFDYNYKDTPSDVFLYLDPSYNEKLPFVSLTWVTPDGRSMELKPKGLASDIAYDFGDGINVPKLLRQYPNWDTWFAQSGQYPTPAFNLLFVDTDAKKPTPQQGRYQLIVKTLLFEEDSDVKSQLVLLGQVYGMAGTDFWRRDLVVPLLWGMPFALIVGLFGTLITIFVAMLLPAIGVWFGGWLDDTIQRLSEINMIMPGLTIAVLAYALFYVNIWIILGIVVVIYSFGSPIKTFRSALLQAKQAPYIEVARAYGASDFRIITKYLIPRILPVLIPQLVTQVPSFIFLEATLGLFNIKSNYPSWGRIIYEGLSRGALYGSQFWVLLPISLLLLTGLAFAMLGSALERVLNPRMLDQSPLNDEKADQPNRGLRRMIFAVGSAVLLLLVFGFSWLNRREVPTASVKSSPVVNIQPTAVVSTSTEVPATVTETFSTPTQILTLEPIATEISKSTPELTSTLSRPPKYSLLKGEFPYCIARRFNVDPAELLTLNNFNSAQTFFTGMVLRIPQSSNPFPGERVLQAHPTVYIVSTENETIASVACLFGDIDPESIAQANQLNIDSNLIVGQSINIP